MVVTLKFPDTFYNKDPKNYDKFFEGLQLMLNRMAMSHEKYQGNLTMDEIIEYVDEVRSLCQRLSMYDASFIMTDKIWGNVATQKPMDTGNTENLLDVANMSLIEWMFPKHPKAKFKAQTSDQSPGLEYKS